MNFILIVIVFVMLASLALGAWSFAPWVPTRLIDVLRMLKLAGDIRGKKFVELGSGDGRATIEAAKAGATATGYEIAIPLYIASQIRALLAQSNAKFVLGDLFRANLRDVDVLFFFGMPKAIAEKLREKMKQELRPGTLVFSYMFKVEDWEPDAVDALDGDKYPIYKYIIKE
ncbi:MAG: hypothetical protein WCJ29_06225 [bacterium]